MVYFPSQKDVMRERTRTDIVKLHLVGVLSVTVYVGVFGTGLNHMEVLGKS